QLRANQREHSRICAAVLMQPGTMRMRTTVILSVLAKDLASDDWARSFATTLRMTMLVLLLMGCRPKDTSKKSAAFLVISGDTGSWITPCGCTTNQSGGLLRRGTYLKQLAEHGQVIYADVGGAVSGNSEYQRMKFEAILRGEIAMGVVAHNIGGAEAS